MKTSEMLIYILLSSFLIYGCNAKGEDKKKDLRSLSDPVIIDITKIKETNTPLKLSQFADSISYIRLSGDVFPESTLLTTIKIIEDTIFLDYDNVYKYTPDGKFIKKVFDEKKSGENIKVGKAAYNNKERYFTVSTRSTTTFKFNNYKNYSFDGLFLGETIYQVENISKKIETYFNNYCVYRNEPEVSTNKKINRLGSNLFYVENTNTNSIFYSHPNPASGDIYPYKHGSDSQPANTTFISIDSVLWFKHIVIDTIYSTKDFVTILPRYIFITDESYMDIHKYTQLKNGLLDDNEIHKLKHIWGFLPFPATGEILLNLGYCLVFTDRSCNTFAYSAKHIINDIDEYLNVIDIATYITNNTFYIENNSLYILIKAEEFFKEGCKPPFDNLKENDAPIVLKLELKK